MSVVHDILVAILLLEKLAQYRNLLLKVLGRSIAGVKRLIGGMITVFGCMIEAAIPIGVWNAVQATPTRSTQDFVVMTVSSITTAMLFASMGLFVIGFGAMYAAPESRLGKHFRNRVFKRGAHRNKRPTQNLTPVYIQIVGKAWTRLKRTGLISQFLHCKGP